MAATINKQRLLTRLLTSVKKPSEQEAEARGVLEEVLFGLCREDSTAEKAQAAFQRLRGAFFDWNEVRVSSVREVEEALGDLPQAELQAQRIISFLQEVFEMYFSFDLDKLQKEGLKQAAKKLARYQAVNDYICAWVVQRCLAGHAIPVDTATLRCTRRLGLIDDTRDDLESIRASLEHLVPKAKGLHFTDAVSLVATEYCHEEMPRCSACPMASECATAQAEPVAPAAAAAGRTSRVKPR